MEPNTTQGSYWKSSSAEGEESIYSSVATAELLMLQ